MWRGLYTGAIGMMSEMKRTDVISNNLANANTTGYKKDITVHGEFEPMLIRRVYDHEIDPTNWDVTRFKQFTVQSDKDPAIGVLGLGDYVDEIARDTSQGALETTGNQLDVAIVGEGYFAVQTDQGVRYTRDGAFFKNFQGVLQNVRGQNILDAQGQPIVIPPGTVNVAFDETGRVFADNQQISQLQFVQFDDWRALHKQGDNLLVAQPGAVPQQATGRIEQGALEKSNTQIVSEMVELIANHRQYEANSKSVVTQDSMLDKSVNEVGRMGG